jgi:hypothetical protein
MHKNCEYQNVNICICQVHIDFKRDIDMVLKIYGPGQNGSTSCAGSICVGHPFYVGLGEGTTKTPLPTPEGGSLNTHVTAIRMGVM